jgi:NAD-dependent histone deacetylase SIR2
VSIHVSASVTLPLLRFHSPSAKAREARSARPLKIGNLRPAIVLYDEIHPLGDEIGAIQTTDLSRKPDLLIIMGTSLKVHGLRKLVKEFAKSVHESSSSSTNTGGSKGKVIFVNKTAPPGEWAGIIDYHVEGETDRWVDKVVEDWKRTRPADWEVQKTLIAGDGRVGISGFKTVKNIKLKEKGIFLNPIFNRGKF